MYPIPSSIKSPQIVAFQSGVNSLSLRVFRNPSDISIWLDVFYAQALLLNMHEYFSGQVCFNLHSACGAMFHLKRSSSASPFKMKIVEENVVFLENTSPTFIVKSSNLPFYSTDKDIVYVTKINWKWLIMLLNSPVNLSNLSWNCQAIFLISVSSLLTSRSMLINPLLC